MHSTKLLSSAMKSSAVGSAWTFAESVPSQPMQTSALTLSKSRLPGCASSSEKSVKHSGKALVLQTKITLASFAQPLISIATALAGVASASELGSILRPNLRTSVVFKEKMAPSKSLRTVVVTGNAP